MAVPVWPTSLPQAIETDTYQEGYGDGRLRSSMEAGPAKVRQRFRPARPLSGIIIMTDDELAAMLAFLDSDLAGGSLPFTFPKGAGRGVGSWLVRFADQMPAYVPSPGLGEWRVTLTLEILP